MLLDESFYLVVFVDVCGSGAHRLRWRVIVIKIVVLVIIVDCLSLVMAGMAELRVVIAIVHVDVLIAVDASGLAVEIIALIDLSTDSLANVLNTVVVHLVTC